MLKWMGRYLAWLCLAIAIAGCGLYGRGWLDQAHIAKVMTGGAKATAIINRARTLSRKRLLTYTIDLTWRDESGNTRRAIDVVVSNAFAEQIISNGVLLTPATEIRYLMAASETLPVVVADADAGVAAAQKLQIRGGGLIVLGMLGGFMFGRLLRRTNPA